MKPGPVSLTCKVMEIGQPQVVGATGNSAKKYIKVECIVADATASIPLSVWDSNIDRLQFGTCYLIQNAY
jgi:hypothetical protein